MSETHKSVIKLIHAKNANHVSCPNPLLTEEQFFPQSIQQSNYGPHDYVFPPKKVSVSSVPKQDLSFLKKPEPTFLKDQIVSYEHLKDKDFCAENKINPAEKESYLSEVEFKDVFGMSKEEFKAMPKWKREGAKKKAELF